ncbi:hypothetical protein SB48_HM08orf04751 [Heyndrickxia coagulans]|uniref:Uncharacterized protein n=1 Tax=Heyndrickxia coagulans TaxID=1398 RepID=A0AAN0WCT5_HEYCO|nr:hypothetical protein SB48_HM08orf04751 [Heyndrickxia coagulans]
MGFLFFWKNIHALGGRKNEDDFFSYSAEWNDPHRELSWVNEAVCGIAEQL